MSENRKSLVAGKPDDRDHTTPRVYCSWHPSFTLLPLKLNSDRTRIAQMIIAGSEDPYTKVKPGSLRDPPWSPPGFVWIQLINLFSCPVHLR